MRANALLGLTLTLLPAASVAGQQEGPPAAPTKFTLWLKP